MIIKQDKFQTILVEKWNQNNQSIKITSKIMYSVKILIVKINEFWWPCFGSLHLALSTVSFLRAYIVKKEMVILIKSFI